MSTMSAAALLAAIRAAPDDDAPRLVYADWLDEHGQPERAEFIRVQCALARRESAALRRREADLLAVHYRAFVGPLAAPGLQFRFHRGFAVGFGHTGVFVWGLPPNASYECLLRFYPDGEVIAVTVSGVTAERPEYVVPWFHRRDPSFARGMYTLCPFDHPAGLSFTTTAPEGRVDYVGTIDRSSLRFEVRSHFSNYRGCETYTHLPIFGFDSFPES